MMISISIPGYYAIKLSKRRIKRLLSGSRPVAVYMGILDRFYDLFRQTKKHDILFALYDQMYNKCNVKKYEVLHSRYDVKNIMNCLSAFKELQLCANQKYNSFVLRMRTKESDEGILLIFELKIQDVLVKTIKCYFEDEVDLSGFDLSEFDLRGTNLCKAKMNKANMCHADLSNADLTGANLSGANLTRANLFAARLTNADLTEANLAEAIMTQTEIKGTILARTIMDLDYRIYLSKWCQDTECTPKNCD